MRAWSAAVLLAAVVSVMPGCVETCRDIKYQVLGSISDVTIVYWDDNDYRSRAVNNVTLPWSKTLEVCRPDTIDDIFVDEDASDPVVEEPDTFSVYTEIFVRNNTADAGVITMKIFYEGCRIGNKAIAGGYIEGRLEVSFYDNGYFYCP